jgi:hypothetical protein
MPWGFALYHLAHGCIEVFFYFSFSFFSFFVAQMKQNSIQNEVWARDATFSIHHHIIAHVLDI